MLATSRVALAAIFLAAPLGAAQAATPSPDPLSRSATATPRAEPGFGMAQTGDMSAGAYAGTDEQDAADAQEDEEDDATPTAPWMMGRGMGGGWGMMGGPGGMSGPGMAGGERPMMQMMHGMMQMMQGMMQMMAHRPGGFAGRGMMPGMFVEEHLAAMKTELGITAAQESQWNAFADAVRTRARAVRGMRAQMMQQGPEASWPDRLAQHERRLTERLDGLKAMEGPTKALWDALSDQQRRKAEAMMPGPMGWRWR